MRCGFVRRRKVLSNRTEIKEDTIKMNRILNFLKDYKIFYVYALLHVLGWLVIMNTNSQENWHPIFYYAYFIVFIQLNLLNLIQVKLLWGTTNIFQAKYLFGIIPDFLIMSFVSIHLLLFITILLKRKKIEIGNAGRSKIDK